MKRNFVLVLVVFAAGLCFLPGRASAIDLFDGKVVIHGKISEQLLMRVNDTQHYEEYDYEVFNARSTLKLETMWHAYEGPEYQVNFYGVWKEFYDAAEHFDGDYKRMLRDAAQDSSKAMEEARTYNKFKDICREMYTEINGPMFQVRLGKQIVSWGETGFERMVDNINPVDLRGNLNPAYPDFAELKQGLWMGRFFFTPPDQPMDMNPAYPDFGELKQGLWMGRFFFTPPDQPMDLTYELLLIPDFEPNVLWSGGSHLMHPRAQNSMKEGNEIYQAYYGDAPDDSWHKMEWGVRIRGFVWGFDWTLSYFHSRVDDGVQAPNSALKSGLGPLLGNTRLTRNLSGSVFGIPLDN
ncbi:MAG: DUF1302 family protein, partial [Deltaproteobacteria bacterium]|nr:DUF1302 family protein [Deltaproteobacteria bacterium]